MIDHFSGEQFENACVNTWKVILDGLSQKPDQNMDGCKPIGGDLWSFLCLSHNPQVPCCCRELIIKEHNHVCESRLVSTEGDACWAKYAPTGKGCLLNNGIKCLCCLAILRESPMSSSLKLDEQAPPTPSPSPNPLRVMVIISKPGNWKTTYE